MYFLDDSNNYCKDVPKIFIELHSFNILFDLPLIFKLESFVKVKSEFEICIIVFSSRTGLFRLKGSWR